MTEIELRRFDLRTFPDNAALLQIFTRLMNT